MNGEKCLICGEPMGNSLNSVHNRCRNPEPTITDKLIREAVEEFEKEYISIEYWGDQRMESVMEGGAADIKSFLETKLRQVVEETRKEAINNVDKKMREFFNPIEARASYTPSDLEDFILSDLKKTYDIP